MHTGNEYLTPGNLAVPVAGGVTILAGQMVGRNASGYAVPAATDSAAVIGVAQGDVVATFANDGDEVVTVKRGAFFLKNKDISLADLSKPCYVADAETVTKEAAGSVAAGIAIAMEDGYVAVETGGYHNGN